MIFKPFWIFSILFIISLLFFYIYQVNVEISERYLIQDYNKRLMEVSKENQDLEIKEAQLNSLGKIAELLKPLNFEKANKIHYLRVLEGQMVVK